jgi:quercetin dioxygenase-like cupin family protein
MLTLANTRTVATAATHRKSLLLMLAATFMACVLGPSAARADTVTDWNEIMQATVSVAPTNPVIQSRWDAIVQLAVFEAVNSIVGDYEPYLGVVDAPAWASPDAAAIAAAHRTLVTLRPTSAATLDPLRAAALAAIADGPEKDAGIAAGEDAAMAMLLLRADDGSAEAATVPYTPGTDPGDWRPAPPSNAPAFLPGWGQVTPFGIEDGAQFRLPPPPPVHSLLYALNLFEVKLLGEIDSPFRPQHRTDVARFYALTSPVQVWNPVARQVSAAQRLTLAENARLLALLDEIHTKAHADGWKIELKTQGLSDVYMTHFLLEPGAHGGWHSHPGPSIIAVKSGTATFYDECDDAETPHVFPAGTGFVEDAGCVHILVNEGDVDLEVVVMQIVPLGAPRRIDEADPRD